MKTFAAVSFSAVVLVILFCTSSVTSQTLCDTAGCLNGDCVLPIYPFAPPTTTLGAPVPTCNCSQGFRPSIVDANICIDINECFEVPFPCNAFQTGRFTFADAGICQNTLGGYTCTECAPGFQRASDGLYCLAVPRATQPFILNPSRLFLYNQLGLEFFKR